MPCNAVIGGIKIQSQHAMPVCSYISKLFLSLFGLVWEASPVNYLFPPFPNATPGPKIDFSIMILYFLLVDFTLNRAGWPDNMRCKWNRGHWTTGKLSGKWLQKLYLWASLDCKSLAHSAARRCLKWSRGWPGAETVGTMKDWGRREAMEN